MPSRDGRRLLLQYLEPSPAVEEVEPSVVRDHLAFAFEQLPVSDLALGWRLRPELSEAVRSVVPPGVTVWRWVPVFVDSGEERPADAHVAVGPDGRPPPPFGDLADFRFLCLDDEGVIEAGLERATRLAREIDADGIMLDRIRWHSPSRAPTAEMTCFCERSHSAASTDGLDLSTVAADLVDAATTLGGRRRIVSALLGSQGPTRISEFLRWRSRTVARSVERLAIGLGAAGLRTALDVFTPALATSVGQDLKSLGRLGEWSKSMTYFDALGPASMPFELAGYSRWLQEAGDTDAVEFLAELIGFGTPGVGASGARTEALETETSRLVKAVGLGRAVVGVDAVEIPGVCEVGDGELDLRLSVLRRAGVGMSPSWELLLIGEPRIARMARAWGGDGPTGGVESGN